MQDDTKILLHDRPTRPQSQTDRDKKTPVAQDLPPCFGQPGGRYQVRDARFEGHIYQWTAPSRTTCGRCRLRGDCFGIRRLLALEAAAG